MNRQGDLRRDDEEVVVENTFKCAHQASNEHVEEEMAAEDDARRGGGKCPRKDKPCDHADEKILQHRHSLVEDIDLLAKQLPEERQPNIGGLNSPHWHIHCEEGDHHERPSRVTARKRPVLFQGLMAHILRTTMLGTMPADITLKQRDKEKIHNESYKQVEKECVNLVTRRKQVCRCRCWNQKNAVAGKLQNSQEIIE